MYRNLIYSICISFLSIGILSAQQQSPQSNQGVKISTKVRKLPSLSEQVAKLEQQVEWAEAQPKMVEDGTLAKYQMALKAKRKALAAEEAERKRIKEQQATNTKK